MKGPSTNAPDRGGVAPPGTARLRVGDAAAGYLLAIVVSALTGASAVALGAGADGLGVLVAGQVGFWCGLVATVVLSAPRPN